MRDGAQAVEENGLDLGVAGFDAGFGDFQIPVAQVGPEEGAEGFGEVGEAVGVDGGLGGANGLLRRERIQRSSRVSIFKF